jgi:hypothetical protein
MARSALGVDIGGTKIEGVDDAVLIGAVWLALRR